MEIRENDRGCVCSNWVSTFVGIARLSVNYLCLRNRRIYSSKYVYGDFDEKLYRNLFYWD